jgi:hypothetical protein
MMGLAQAICFVTKNLLPPDRKFTEVRLFQGQIQYRFHGPLLSDQPTPWMVFDTTPTPNMEK